LGTTDIALERIFKQLIRGNAGMAIAELETYLSAWSNPQTAEKLQAVKAEYELMADYWQRGAKDPQIDKQYQRLLQRVYVLSANISIHRHMKSSSFLSTLSSGVRQQGRSWTLDAIRHEMEGFVSDVAMLELESEDQRQVKSRLGKIGPCRFTGKHIATIGSRMGTVLCILERSSQNNIH
jgi:hypothetical protein